MIDLQLKSIFFFLLTLWFFPLFFSFCLLKWLISKGGFNKIGLFAINMSNYNALFAFSVWNYFYYFMFLLFYYFIFFLFSFSLFVLKGNITFLLRYRTGVYLNNRFFSITQSLSKNVHCLFISLVFVCTFASSFASSNLISSYLINHVCFITFMTQETSFQSKPFAFKNQKQMQFDFFFISCRIVLFGSLETRKMAFQSLREIVQTR